MSIRSEDLRHEQAISTLCVIAWRVMLIGFPDHCTCDTFLRMKVIIWFRKMLPVLAILGLIIGPFATPLSAPAIAGASMAAMPADMSCCPDETPPMPDCQEACPLMAMCMAKCFSVSPVLAGMAIIFWDKGDRIRPASDVAGDALEIEPPARPPRI